MSFYAQALKDFGVIDMGLFLNYLVFLGWAIVVSVIMAVTLGMSIWILDKMLLEVKGLRHLMKKPISAAIVLGSFILSVGIIIAAFCK